MRILSNSNLLLWVPRYWPAVGGAELHTRRLAAELAPHHRVRVLTHATLADVPLARAAAAAGMQMIRDGDVDICRIGLTGFRQRLLDALGRRYGRARGWRWLYACVFRLMLRAKARRVAGDCTLIHAVYNGLTESAELAADTARDLGVPFIWTPLACTDGPLAGAWSTRRFRKLYRRAQALVALTAHEREWLIAQGAPAERVHVCPVGPLVVPAPAVRVRARLGIGDAALVLYLGRVTHAKGADRLVEAAGLVWARYPSARFLFVGPQDQDSHRLFGAGADPRLIAWSQVNQEEKCAALRECDMLCLPSSAESLGGVLLEAWYYARPVIAHDLPVLREVVAHGRDGILTAHDAAALAQAIVGLIGDPESRRRMGLAGQQKVAEHYTWERIGRRMRAIYATASGRV